MNTLFLDSKGQFSWGRVCSAVALGVAVVGQFSGLPTMQIAVWLGVATGNYGLSKVTEAVAGVFGGKAE